MTRPRIVAVAGAAVLSCVVGVLVFDYARARVRAPRDAASVLELQRQVETDRSRAPALAAEQDRITRTRQARKRRDDWLTILAIAAAAVFVAGRKWEIAGRGPRPSSERVGAPREAPLTGSTGRPASDRAAAADLPALDLSPVDQLIARFGRSKEAAIPILQAIQAHYRYLPDEALRRVCELTEVTPAQIAGTSTFYARFRRSPVGDHVVRVCHGTACHVAGARQITEELRRHLHIPDGADTDPARRFTIDEVACIGCCSLAPVMLVDEETAGRLTPSAAVAALSLARDTEPA